MDNAEITKIAVRLNEIVEELHQTADKINPHKELQKQVRSAARLEEAAGDLREAITKLKEAATSLEVEVKIKEGKNGFKDKP